MKSLWLRILMFLLLSFFFLAGSFASFKAGYIKGWIDSCDEMEQIAVEGQGVYGYDCESQPQRIGSRFEPFIADFNITEIMGENNES